MRKLDFDKTFLEAVDHALLTFGETPRQAIYYHLDKNFKLHKEEIAKDADEFSQALTTLFGPGAQVIEKIIVKNLYSKLNLSFDEKNQLEFVDHISLARGIARREQQRLRVGKVKRNRVRLP